MISCIQLYPSDTKRFIWNPFYYDIKNIWLLITSMKASNYRKNIFTIFLNNFNNEFIIFIIFIIFSIAFLEFLMTFIDLYWKLCFLFLLNWFHIIIRTLKSIIIKFVFLAILNIRQDIFVILTSLFNFIKLLLSSFWRI
jgi:hypothetical protein